MASGGTISFSFEAKGLDKVRQGTDGLAGGLKNTNKAAAKATAGLKAAAKAAAAFTAAGLAVGYALKKVADSAGSFEYELARAGAITEATAKEMAILEKAAIQAGLATQFSPREAAEGLATLGSFGLDAAQAAHVLKSALDLAAAGMIEVEAASESVVNMLRIYRMPVSKAVEVTDKLVTITNMSSLKARDFGVSLGKAASKTAVANQTFETTLIVMGALRSAGNDAASAGTYYNRSVINMATNTKALNALQDVGVSLYEKGTKKVRQMTDVVFELEKALKKYNPKEQMRIKAAVFGSRAIGTYNAITGIQAKVVRDGTEVILRGNEALQEQRRRLDESSGAAERFRERLLDTYQGQKTLLAGTLETLAIVTGKPFANMFKPIVGGLVNSLNDLIKLIQRTPEQTKKLVGVGVAGFGALLVAIGACATAVLSVGVAMKFIVPIASAGLGAMPALFGAATKGAMALSAKLLPLIVIIGTIALVVGLLYEANERSLGGVGRVWDWITDKVTFAAGYYRAVIVRTAKSVSETWNTFTYYLGELWDDMWMGIGTTTKDMINMVTEVMNAFTNKIFGLIGGLVRRYGDFLYALGYEEEAAALRGLRDDLEGFDADWAKNFALMNKEWIQPTKKAMADFGDAAIDLGTNMAKTMGGIGKDIGLNFMDGFGMATTGLKKLVGKMMTGMSLALPDLGDSSVNDVLGPAKKQAKQVLGTQGKAVKPMTSEQRIQAAGKAIGGGGAIAPLVTGIAGALGTAIGPAASAALGVLDTVMGMSDAGQKLKADLGMVLSTLAEALSPLFSALRPVVEVLQVVGELAGMIFEVVFAFSLFQPALFIAGKLLQAIALVVKNLMIGFREFYLTILRLIDAIPGIDMTRQIREVQAAQNREVRERNELIERLRGQATLDEQRARRERELAAATREATSAMLNVPSGYKIARAGFGAEAPVMDDFIMRPGQPAQQFSSNDTIVGTKNGGASGPTIVIQNLEVRASNPTAFFNRLMRMVNQDERAGGVSLGGAYQGRL